MAENSGDSIPVETKEGEEEEAAASRDVEDEPETIQQLKQKVGTIYKILIFLFHILKGTYLPSRYLFVTFYKYTDIFMNKLWSAWLGVNKL